MLDPCIQTAHPTPAPGDRAPLQPRPLAECEGAEPGLAEPGSWQWALDWTWEAREPLLTRRKDKLTWRWVLTWLWTWRP